MCIYTAPSGVQCDRAQPEELVRITAEVMSDGDELPSSCDCPGCAMGRRHAAQLSWDD